MATNLLSELRSLVDSQALPVGTRRKRADGEYQKQSDGQWTRVTAGPTPARPEPASPRSGGALPTASELRLKGSANHLGGGGDKRMYVDAQGREYLFKIAASKDGSKVEPHRAHVQAAYAAIARKVKPNHPPIETATLDGVLGTLQPFMAAKGHLRAVAPAALTDTEKLGVASDHVLDWLGSQHDSHGANLLRTQDGDVVSVDKEQGFKYFPNDELSTDYHPNAKYGEREPYYNTFWRDWSEGQFDFDPASLKPTIEAVERISPEEYTDTLRPYAKTRSKGDPAKEAAFLDAALQRKLDIRKDFEGFFSQLYQMRTGEQGTFTFNSGWSKTESIRGFIDDLRFVVEIGGSR